MSKPIDYDALYKPVALEALAEQLDRLRDKDGNFTGAPEQLEALMRNIRAKEIAADVVRGDKTSFGIGHQAASHAQDLALERWRTDGKAWADSLGSRTGATRGKGTGESEG